MNDIFESKLFKGIIIGLGCFVILAFVFCLGLAVGTKRADFSFKWAEAYHRNFGGPPNGFFGNMMGNEFANPNGIFGQIIEINGQNITMKGKDDVEKIIIADSDVTIKFQTKTEKLSDLRIGDNVVVIGEPNSSGQIDAKLIRVMPK